MKLSDYIRARAKLSVDAIFYEAEATRIVNALMEENAADGGRKYPTIESLWAAAIAKAEELERGNVHEKAVKR